MEDGLPKRRPKELLRTLNFVRELRNETFREAPDNASSELKVCYCFAVPRTRLELFFVFKTLLEL